MDINDDLVHYGNMLAGCESINDVLANGGKLSYEGRYAQTVLSLHAQDAGFVAGTEGFVENVKAGAGKAIKWIMDLLKSIRDFFFGSHEEQVKKAGANAEKAADIIANPNKLFGAGITQSLDIQANFTVSKSAAETAKKQFNALSPEAKKEAEEEFKAKAKENSLNETGQATVDKIKAAITTGATALKRPASEIARLNAMEDGGLSNRLGLGDGNAYETIIGDILGDIKGLKVSTISNTVKYLIKVADGANTDLKDAVKELEGLTKKIGETGNQADQRKLSRAGMIVNELAKIVKGTQQLVITVNNALTQAIRSEQDKVVAAILRKNKITVAGVLNKDDDSEAKEKLTK
ncbi:hypothetical protein pETSU_038 [Edwardsiella phage pEt-SU]|uniref:Uncharacterized protein n=1 Tax=Edwardsiella phage pEt-SU TaxID=2562142 RepID=A0A4D6DY55_9CAUD|nr:hypothetical protein HOV39_gp038 [Edwardsiella phage pEt-SU]QBZ70619.1 hypothetical protein pETSU_038 [Edwardsiella phage pEt-SU]